MLMCAEGDNRLQPVSMKHPKRRHLPTAQSKGQGRLTLRDNLYDKHC